MRIGRAARTTCTSVLASSAIFIMAVPEIGRAATAGSDGIAFPCTKRFAKQVAIDSDFNGVAGILNPRYSNPRNWTAAQAICADFDEDGNDEMAFSLKTKNGIDPWAFFNVPYGRPGDASYFAMTISNGRHATFHFAEHHLHLVFVAGLPVIQDARQLYRPKDRNCCPSGAWFIRVVGFPNGKYKLFSSGVRRTGQRKNKLWDVQHLSLRPADYESRQKWSMEPNPAR